MKVVSRILFAASTLMFIATVNAQTAAPRAAGSLGGAGELPAGPAQDVVTKACTGCHAAAQFTGQGRSRDEWKEMVVKMIGYGAEVPEEKEAVIVDYLAKHYPAEK